MQYLRQSTASQSVVIGPFVDSTDGTTAETALSIANTDIRLSANGGNIVAKNSGGGTHDELGFYTITLDATDTATVGRLQLICKMAGALVVYHEYQVVEESTYDFLYASGADPDGQIAALATASALATAQADLDTITGSDGVTLATTQGNYAPAKAGDNMGTVSAVTGGINTGAGTITTLDALDTAQDTQHGTTQTAISNLNDPTAGAIADAVWDEVITGAEHNVNTSAAKFLRESSQSAAMLTGTAQAGAATTITLASGAVAANDILNGERISILEGTGAGQSRLITDSAVTTDVVTVAHAWTTNPDNTSIYAITGAEVDVRAIDEDPQSADDLKDFVDAGYDPATNHITGIAGTLNTLDQLDTAQDTQHGTTQTLLGTPVADVSTDIAAVKTVVDALPAATDIVSGGAITTSGGIASADVKKINGATVIGDGNATPWDGA